MSEGAGVVVPIAKYRRLVKSIARKYVPERDVEDVTQEACIKLWLKGHTFQGNAALESWIYSVTKNEAGQWMRRTWHRLCYMEELPEMAVRKDWGSYYELCHVVDCIKKLPPRSAEVMWLRLKDLPKVKIAEEMGVTTGCVSGYYTRGRDELVRRIRRDEQRHD